MPNTKPAPPYSKGRVSALGVFAEIATILARHRQKTSLAISLPLQEKIRSALPALGIKNIPPEKLNQIVLEITQETTTQTLEDLAKVETPEQIIVVLADNLTGAIINHPELAAQIKIDDTKIFTRIIPQAQEIYTQNQDVLEKAAVLANLSSIAKLQVGNAQVKNLINNSVEQTVEIEAPLTPPKQREVAKADLANYLTAYKEELAKTLIVTLDNIPTLKTLQVAKENAHAQATEKMTRATIPISPKPTTAISPKILTDNLAKFLALLPPRPTSAPPKLPPGGNLILTSPTRVRDAYLSLLSLDQEKLAGALKETSQEIERYKNKKSLAYGERRAYQDALKKQARYVAAQAFHVKQPKKAGAYRALFAQAYGGRAEIASQQAWIAENYFLPSMPRAIARNERLAAGAAFGSLGFSFAGFNPGSLFSKIRGAALANTAVGMGLAPTSLVTKNPVASVGRIVRNVAGLTLGGLYLLAAALGKAALMGAVIGSAIGVGAGAAFGVAILAPLGPIGWAAMPIVVPMTTAAGGLVGGVAGMLVGFGVAAGSATAISMGVGAGVGGTIGGIVGFNVGVAVGAATMTAAIGLCIGSAICAPFAPLLIAVSPTIVTMFGAIGATVGAAVGTLIGAGVGYLFGHYVVGTLGIQASAALAGAAIGFYFGGPIGAAIGAGIGWLATGGWVQVKNFFAGTPSVVAGAGAGFFSAAAGFFTGLASTIWGGLSAAGGAIVGFFGGAANFIVGGLSSLAIPASAAAIPVAGGIGAVAVGGTVVGIVAATSFFNPETDVPVLTPPGENQFFLVKKTANPPKLKNEDLPADLDFVITLTAKVNLTNIKVADKLTVRGQNGNFQVTEDKAGQPIPPLGTPACPEIPDLSATQSWQCQFTITATADPGRDFRDSVVTNTATVTATPEGQSAAITDFATASVIIGQPPADCPNGWPTAHGRITQGPQGSASHAALATGGEQAIDIGENLNHEETFATFNGTVFLVDPTESTGYGLHVDVQGVCDGQAFRARWAHLLSIDPQIKVGEQVVVGQRIGRIDNTGYSLGDHLHYSFFGLEMREPYTPKTPTPPSCEDGGTPCNISW